MSARPIVVYLAFRRVSRITRTGSSSIAKFTPPASCGDRISDADRERAEERLNEALAEGRITVPELEEHLDAVYAAVYAADLRLPLAELPGDDIVDPTAGGRRSDAKPLVLRAGDPASSVPVTDRARRSGAPHFIVLGRTRLGSVIVRRRRGIGGLRF